MKLHETLVEKLLKIYEVNSGWSEEWKLKAALQNVDISVYTRENGTQVLVPTDELVRHTAPAWRQEADMRDQRVARMVQEAERANKEE